MSEIRRTLLGLMFLAAASSAEVTVVVRPGAPALEQFAAHELASYLTRIYPDERFAVRGAPAATGGLIVFERRDGAPESYAISASGNSATIESADPKGTLFAVYALLERLGCGFYLSSETLPPPHRGHLTFEAWKMADAPLFADRIVFDWHNFLSSASTWEFADWQRYIDGAARMRFNGLMVHAYGNNPMFAFHFGGITKPVGYLATTRAGRDWGTEHVNDVRRLIGGEHFDDAVFGSSAAKVPVDQRGPAATKLMQRVFTHATERGLGITFALDVDTESANPPQMIATLPASARIAVGKYQLANPDTQEGYAFYKAQVEQLFSTYPQITRLAVWFRNNATPWMNIQREQFPAAWRQEFRGSAADAPMFAIGKLVAAYGRALRDTGHRSVELAAGSWRLNFLEAADRYFPREVTLIPLDWSTVFDTPAGQRALRTVKSGRRLIPVVWAHHDDRTYIGRPYTPYVNFASLLKSAGGSGFGIIHWTTRPLDLYFKSTLVQSWSATANEPLEVTCAEMAARLFGESAREAGRDYLFAWVTEGPMFGRETTDRFMDVPLTDPALHIKRSAARSELLARVTGSAAAEYFRRYEEFTRAFFETQIAFEQAEAALKAGEYDKARASMAKAQPEAAIRLYASIAATSGEKALIVSLNLRWLPNFLSQRQAAGIEPIRYRVGTVEREPLAQGAGTHTFFVDEHSAFWRVIDRTELHAPLRLGAILGHRLAPGLYSVNGGAPQPARDGLVEIRLPVDGEVIIRPVSP